MQIPHLPQVKTWALSPLRYESGIAERPMCDPFGVVAMWTPYPAGLDLRLCTCDPFGVLSLFIFVPSDILLHLLMIHS